MTTTRLYAAVNKSQSRPGSPIWTAKSTPERTLQKAEQEAGLDPDTLDVVPVGPRLARLIEIGSYDPSTRWEVTEDGVAELVDD